MNIRDAKTLARKTMRAHGLIAQGWVLEFDQAVSRAGCCMYRRKVISLSEPITLLNPKDKVMNTILHEVAHALTPGEHHNRIWKQLAISIGCDGERCYGEETKAPPRLVIGKCPECPAIMERHRMPKKKQYYHTACLRLGKRNAITWERKEA